MRPTALPRQLKWDQWILYSRDFEVGGRGLESSRKAGQAMIKVL